MIRPLTTAHTQIVTNASYERLPRAGSAITRRARLIPKSAQFSPGRGAERGSNYSDDPIGGIRSACIAQGFRSADKTAKGVGDAQPDKRPCNQYRYPSYPAHEGTRIRFAQQPDGRPPGPLQFYDNIIKFAERGQHSDVGYKLSGVGKG